MRQRRAIWLVLLFYAALAVRAAVRVGPTADEPGQLASGVRHWQTGQFDCYRVNPPLVRLLGSLPFVLLGPTERFSVTEQDRICAGYQRPEFPLGDYFFESVGDEAMSWLVIARLAIALPFGLLGAFGVWRWARELFGEQSGLLALTLWCLHPLVLGHGALLTMDVPAAACGVWLGRAFWRWASGVEARRGRNVLALGGWFGVSIAVKSTWIVAGPLVALGWLMLRLVKQPNGLLSAGLDLAMAGVLGLLVLNLSYVFHDFGEALGAFQFRSRTLNGAPPPPATAWTSTAADNAQADGVAAQAADDAPAVGVAADTKTCFGPDCWVEPAPGNRFRGTWLESMPVPVPGDYLLGIDLQKVDFERGWRTWLVGRKRNGSVFEFYLVTLVLKSPVGLLALLVLAVLFTPRVDLATGYALAAPIVVILSLLTMNSTINCTRYAIVVLPFVMVWVSGLLAGACGGGLPAAGDEQSGGGTVLSAAVQDGGSKRRDRLTVAGWLCTVHAAASSIMASPFFLTYTNEFVSSSVICPLGGWPNSASNHMAAVCCFSDSQMDWGQTGPEVLAWLEEQELDGDRPLFVDVRQPVRNEHFLPELRRYPMPILPRPGLYVVSSDQLFGRVPCSSMPPAHAAVYRWLIQREPSDVIAGCVLVFDLNEEDLP